MLYFVTFANKLTHDQAKAVLSELRKQLPPHSSIVFSPRPPAGKKTTRYIQGVVVVITTPYKPSSQSDKQEGQFTLGEMWDKITKK